MPCDNPLTFNNIFGNLALEACSDRQRIAACGQILMNIGCKSKDFKSVEQQQQQVRAIKQVIGIMKETFENGDQIWMAPEWKGMREAMKRCDVAEPMLVAMRRSLETHALDETMNTRARTRHRP
jgi:hypothetical protein